MSAIAGGAIRCATSAAPAATAKLAGITTAGRPRGILISAYRTIDVSSHNRMTIAPFAQCVQPGARLFRRATGYSATHPATNEATPEKRGGKAAAREASRFRPRHPPRPSRERERKASPNSRGADLEGATTPPSAYWLNVEWTAASGSSMKPDAPRLKVGVIGPQNEDDCGRTPPPVAL
jgi:hypothetical protein